MQLVDRQLDERGRVTLGHDHDVPIVVGIPIGDDVGGTADEENEWIRKLTIECATENALVVGFLGRHVVEAPRSVEAIHSRRDDSAFRWL